MPGKSTFARLCGCSFIHPGRSLHEGLKLVKQFGFANADIAIGGGNAHFNSVEVARSPISFADKVRREVEFFELTPNECFVLNFGVPINTPDLEEQKNTSQLFMGLCRFAQLSHFKSILFIPGPVYPELGARASLDLAVAAFTDLVSIACDHDLQLNVEADYESCAHTPEAASELFQRVPGLGLTLDYSHFIYQDIAPERIEILHPFTRHLHIRQAAPRQIVTDVNNGNIDYAKVIKQLEKSGYNGLYCIEYLSLDTDKSTFDESEKRTWDMIGKMKKI